MKDLNPIVLALPFFFISIAVELFVAFKKKRKLYRLNDSLSNLICGALEQTTGILTSGALFGIYVWIYENTAFIPWAKTQAWPQWVVMFLLIDLAYYFFHRSSHRVNIFWATHIVHHNSEEYNLTVALRQGPLQKFASMLFYLPLALIGFPPGPVYLARSINTLYQFWIHSRLIPKLGPLEYIFNTPSHHRIHHARDDRYLDKNFAGTFIIWDRLFGTFVEEVEEPHYGVLRPVESFNPLWSVFHWWQHIVKMVRQGKGLEKIVCLFAPPGYRPKGWVDTPVEQPRVNYDPQISKNAKIFATILFSCFLIFSIFILANKSLFTGAKLYLSVVLVCMMAIGIGSILSRKSAK